MTNQPWPHTPPDTPADGIEEPSATMARQADDTALAQRAEVAMAETWGEDWDSWGLDGWVFQ